MLNIIMCNNFTFLLQLKFLILKRNFLKTNFSEVDYLIKHNMSFKNVDYILEIIRVFKALPECIKKKHYCIKPIPFSIQLIFKILNETADVLFLMRVG